MPSLIACMFSLALSGASGSVIRTSQTIRSDGTVDGSSKSPGALLEEVIKLGSLPHAGLMQHGGAVQLGVSASGQTEPMMRTADQVFESRVQSMLSDIQEMARSGVTPAKDKIQVIKDLVEKELIVDLQSTHSAADQQVTTNLASIVTCNTNGNTELTKIKGADGAETAVSTARTAHSTCREAQKGKSSEKDTACQALDQWLKEVSNPATEPTEGSPGYRDQMVDYIEKMSDYYCPKGPKATEMKKACTDAEAAHATHKSSCDQKQGAFESGFCQWRTRLVDTCSNLGTCYSDALKVYNDHKTATTDLVAKWKVEYSALKKISCYCDVWLGDEAAAKTLASCESLNVDTTPMDIDFKTPADKITCSLDAVANYPGTAAFKTNEYKDFADYVVAVIACLQAGADL